MKRKYEVQFPTNPILNDEIEKKKIKSAMISLSIGYETGISPRKANKNITKPDA